MHENIVNGNGDDPLSGKLKTSKKTFSSPEAFFFIEIYTGAGPENRLFTVCHLPSMPEGSRLALFLDSDG
jgi:hypothetical protein